MLWAAGWPAVGYSSPVSISVTSRNNSTMTPADRWAEVCQAEHYRRVLLDQCAELADRLLGYAAVRAKYQRRGELAQVRRIDSVMRAAAREQATLQRLLGALDERFPQPAHQLAVAVD